MSSRASATLRIELPARLLADALAAATWLALGLTVVAWLVLAGDFATVTGLTALLGFVAAMSLFATHGRRRRPCRVELARDGRLRVTYDDGRVIECADAAGHRVLGRTVYLRGAPAGPGYGPGGSVWLTPWDVPAVDLRRLAVGLRCSAGRLEM
jgi:hypothetical protein